MDAFCLFFFFQAEDGIRDLYVTGVQTCALPIWPGFGGEGSRAARQVTRPSRRAAAPAAAPSSCADRPARAARPPRGAPPPRSCPDSGGPGRCAARAEDGVRPLGGWETSEERRQ